jgi:hypothetical protein
MGEDGTARLERVMTAGFETLADLQRETNARLDQTNARLENVERAVDGLTARVVMIEDVLKDFAAQLLGLTRVVRQLVENQDNVIADLGRRLAAIEKRLGPEH